jgi:hypothetical protein
MIVGTALLSSLRLNGADCADGGEQRKQCKNTNVHCSADATITPLIVNHLHVLNAIHQLSKRTKVGIFIIESAAPEQDFHDPHRDQLVNGDREKSLGTLHEPD